MKYSFAKGLRKGLVAFVAFALPALTGLGDWLTPLLPVLLPAWLNNLTIGAAIVMFFNWLKVKYKVAVLN